MASSNAKPTAAPKEYASSTQSGRKPKLSGAARRRMAREKEAANAASGPPPGVDAGAAGPNAEPGSAATLPIPNGRLIERLPREAGSKGGAPRFAITDAGLALIHNAMANGAAINALPPRLGIGQTAFKHMRASDPRINEAIDEGLAANETALVGVLMAAALKGNVTAAIYLTKTLHGFEEGSPRATGEKLLGTIKVKLLPANLSASDFDKQFAPKPGEHF